MTFSVDLSGKTAFVTGASSGFGAHFAQLLASNGARVFAGARRAAALGELASSIRAEGGDATAVALDVRDFGSIRAALAVAGPVDILVNNAGVGAPGPVLEHTEADWSMVMDTNLRGAFFMATEAAKAMREAQISGSIINIASILGLRQGMGVSSYAISKAALIQLTKQLALELARYGIRVNALAPGYFGTDINRTFFESDAGAALIKRIAMRRLGELDDLDGPLLLLASDASKFMTGSVIEVDGGHLLSGL